MTQLHHVVITIERALDDLTIGAVNQHGDRLGEKRIRNVLPLKRDHAVFSGNVGQLDNLGNKINRVVNLSREGFAHDAHGPKELP